MKTPAEWKTLFESSAFARQTNYSGPLGPEYNPSGTRLRIFKTFLAKGGKVHYTGKNAGRRQAQWDTPTIGRA